MTSIVVPAIRDVVGYPKVMKKRQAALAREVENQHVQLEARLSVVQIRLELFHKDHREVATDVAKALTPREILEAKGR